MEKRTGTGWVGGGTRLVGDVVRREGGDEGGNREKLKKCDRSGKMRKRKKNGCDVGMGREGTGR